MGSETSTLTSPIDMAPIDRLLSAQLIVAWAGERGNEDERRLGWWRTDLVSEFGGQDFFQRLLPHTWQWAMFQSVREAARRHDQTIRDADHNPDRLQTLFSLGFDVEERSDERLMDFKRSGKSPQECLPELRAMLDGGWSVEAFAKWVAGHGKVDLKLEPSGRRLRGKMPESLSETVDRLVAALAPVGEHYPLPHFRREA